MYVLNKRTCILDMEVRMYGQDCIKCGQAGTIKLYEDEKERLMIAFVDHLSRKYYNKITLKLMFRQLEFPEDAYTQIFQEAGLSLSILEATNLSCYSKTKNKLSLTSSNINELFQRVQTTFGYASLSPEEQMRAKDLKELLKLVFKKRQLVKTKRPSNGGGRSGKTAKGHQRSLCHACKHGVCSASKVTSR
ncbi:hypothetical protein FGO68_gene330 [Halteria grandinella]|uniref:Uncharacterized protein n=1 Tax=Halteria grandinella TaxID=5974 RepID=A0A8J8NL16_HALGN|nr:hypothetical protein FGO68_gene330 [Halteria grandinella]